MAATLGLWLRGVVCVIFTMTASRIGAALAFRWCPILVPKEAGRQVIQLARESRHNLCDAEGAHRSSTRGMFELLWGRIAAEVLLLLSASQKQGRRILLITTPGQAIQLSFSSMNGWRFKIGLRQR